MNASLARRGGGFLAFLLSVALLTVIAVLGYGVYANWQLDHDGDGEPDGFTMRVLDPDWWTASRDQARSQVDELSEWAMANKEAIWGEGGLLDESEQLVEPVLVDEDQEAGAQEPEAVEAAEPATGEEPAEPDALAAGELPAAGVRGPTIHGHAEHQKSPHTQRLEDRIANAEAHYADGIEAYRAAEPSQGWTPERLRRLAEAQEHFEAVRNLLYGERRTLDEYAQASDHDPALLERAQAMLHNSQRLLHASIKSGGGI